MTWQSFFALLGQTSARKGSDVTPMGNVETREQVHPGIPRVFPSSPDGPQGRLRFRRSRDFEVVQLRGAFPSMKTLIEARSGDGLHRR